MQQLYPLKFYPIYKEKLWGGTRFEDTFGRKDVGCEKCGESWELSAVQGDISVVANGFLKGNTIEELIEIYMDEIVGEKVYDEFGVEFPLLFKFLDSNQILSVQVHPDNDFAKVNHKAYGKTEMWYIVDAEENAELITGFVRDSDIHEFVSSVEKNSVTELLNIEKAKKGDVFYIPAGRVHTCGKGLLIAEVQQTSDVTYRIYDWNRTDADGKKRELHIDMAKEVIDYKRYDNYRTEYEKKSNEVVNVVESQYFTTNLIEFDKDMARNYHHLDSFVVYMCVEGEFDIHFGGSEVESVETGSSILVPAALKELVLAPKCNTKILEVYIM